MDSIAEDIKKLNNEIDVFEDDIMLAELNALDFIDSPHTSEDTENCLNELRQQQKIVIRHSIKYTKLKREKNAPFSRAAKDLCKRAGQLQVKICDIRHQLEDDRDQHQRKEDKIEANVKRIDDKHEDGIIKRCAFITGTTYFAYKISQIPFTKNDLIAVAVGLGASTIVAFNNSFRRKSAALNDNFTIYWMRETIKDKTKGIRKKSQRPSTKSRKANKFGSNLKCD